MWNQNSVQETHKPATLGQSAGVPTELGLSSAVKELWSEVCESVNLAQNLRSSLGISIPSASDLNKGSEPPQSPCAMLRELVYGLRKANADFGEVLRHVNS